MLQDANEKGLVIDTVRNRLPKEGLDVLPLRVIEEGVRKEGEWWIVPIQASRVPNPRYPYYEALAELEGNLEEEDHMDVVIVPVDPD
ncbi:MAG: hypothetical protein KC931_06425 [Candidatus Omnitrophica bacterium]|nr:hypothetical protein [Candidatus Omnitrophota bacterium]MCB9781517.1 hypothetical protein [Candidatus Omnitrophota bacterium]